MSKIRSDSPSSRSGRLEAPKRAAAAIGLALTLVISACGDESDPKPNSAADSVPGGEQAELTLVLDFVPNAVHTGIYCALGRGYYADGGLDLEIVEPSSTADTLKLIEAGEADLGIADGIDVADQIDRGRAAMGVLALTQRPLGGLIALQSSGIGDPAELVGKTVGVTGVPSDDAVLEAMIRSSGGDPSGVDTVTIGFNGAQALLNGRVDAFTGFIVADSAQVESTGSPVTAFGIDEYGGPRYPGLVVFSTSSRIAREREAIEAFVEATVRGYEDTLSDPDGCIAELLDQNPELEPQLQRVQLDSYLPLFQADAEAYGEFRHPEVEALVDFLIDSDLIEERVDPSRYATNEFVVKP